MSLNKVCRDITTVTRNDQQTASELTKTERCLIARDVIWSSYQDVCSHAVDIDWQLDSYRDVATVTRLGLADVIVCPAAAAAAAAEKQHVRRQG